MAHARPELTHFLRNRTNTEPTHRKKRESDQQTTARSRRVKTADCLNQHSD
jgi:hypothetical protein